MASNDGKLDYCVTFGATHTINYKKNPDFSELVKEFTGGKGVDLIQDPVLASNFNYNIKCLSMDSRWVIYGTMGGIKLQETNMVGPLLKRAKIIFATLRSRSDDYKADIIADIEDECMPRFRDGSLKPIIDRVMPLS